MSFPVLFLCLMVWAGPDRALLVERAAERFGQMRALRLAGREEERASR